MENAKYFEYLEQMELEDTHANIKGMNNQINHFSKTFYSCTLLHFGKSGTNVIIISFTYTNQIKYYFFTKFTF